MSNYQTVNLPRDLAERIAKVCMFTLPAEDSQQLRTILAKPSGEPAAWFDPVHNDFLTAAGRATTISMGDGDRLARYTVPLYAAPTAAEELDSVRHWRGKHAEAVRERDQLKPSLNEWFEKCEWARQQLQPKELGMHIADVIKQRFDILLAERNQLLSDLTAQSERIDELESQFMPDLHSRPEERGTPETEPCSGCGTPGWTGACTKCIPY